MDSWRTGTELGPYVLLRLIGAGGMGEVWKAIDRRLRRTVAIKRLTGPYSSRFEREAKAIAAINHPHICQIHDVGSDYLVLEYIEGQPLGGPLRSGEAIKLAIEIADALEAAHQKGILHRDLKPANILVSDLGVKLLDFGLAKSLDTAEDQITRTLEGMVMGTVAYMSPEQARGLNLDIRSDIFSFGVVLYEMLSGRQAFTGGSMLDLMNAVVSKEPPPLEAPDGLVSIVARCMRKDPAERFLRMSEVKAAIETFALTERQAGTSPSGNLPRSAIDEGRAKSNLVEGLPTRWAAQVEGFLLQYLGTQTHPAPFGGRERDLANLNAWLEDDSAPRFGLITARAGLGKSALLAHWVFTLQQMEVQYDLLYFPISARMGTNSETAVLESLSWRLAFLFRERAPETSDLATMRELIAGYLMRARQSQRNLLLILDGLDEAAGWSVSTDLFPPSTSPYVRVLVAARPLGGDEDDAWLRKLGWKFSGIARSLSLNNLDRAAVESVLEQMGNPLRRISGRMDFARILFEKTEGDPLLVGLYVEKLREHDSESGSFRLDAFASTAPGLRGFFRYWMDEQTKIWGANSEERRHRADVIMALCSLAKGPLHVEDIQQLAPGEFPRASDIRQTAVDLQRLLLGDGSERGYVFGHPRFADFVREEWLREEDQIRYENRFIEYGNRAVLEFFERKRGWVPEYIVRWHTAHLEECGRSITDFLPLLNIRWAEEWIRVDGSSAGFLADLDRIWRRADGRDQVGIRILVALIRSSVLSQARGISLRLFKQCVAAEILSPTLAEVIARQQEDVKRVCDYLLAIVDSVQGNKKRTALEAVAVARQIPDKFARVSVLKQAANHLDGRDREKTLEEATDLAREIQHEFLRARALCIVAESLQERVRDDVLQEALAAARRIPGDYRSWAIGNVAKLLEGRGREHAFREALLAARQIQTHIIRGDAYCSIVTYLPDHEREEALREALVAATRKPNLGSTLLSVLETFESKDYYLLHEALAAARELSSDLDRATAIGVIARCFDVSTREGIMREAMEVARSVRDGLRAGALIRLAQYLRGSGRETAIREALDAIPVSETPASDLSRLAERLVIGDRELRRDAIVLAREIQVESERVEALCALAVGADVNDGQRILSEALSYYRSIHDEKSRAIVLGALAGRLDSEDSRGMIHEAFTVVAEIRGALDQARAIAVIARYMDPTNEDFLGEALTAARLIPDGWNRADALYALAHRLNGEERRSTLLEALGAGKLVLDEESEAVKIHDVAEQLDASDYEWIEEALGVAREFEDAFSRSYSLSGIARLLDGTDRKAILVEALIAARKDGVNNAVASLGSVAALLGRDDRQDVLREALAVARKSQDEEMLSSHLSVFATYLESGDHEFLGDALADVLKIQYETFRVLPLTRILQKLDPQAHDLVREALTAARQVHDPEYRAELLGTISGRLEGAASKEIIREMLFVLNQLSDLSRAHVLQFVVRNTHGTDRELSRAFLNAVSGIPAPETQGSCIEVADFERWFGDMIFDDRISLLTLAGGLAAAGALRFVADNWEGLCRAKGSDPAAELTLWVEKLSRTNRPVFLAGLAQLASVIEAVGGKNSVYSVYRSIIDVSRWWP